MFSKLGTSVAIEMEKILSSDAHANLFYKQAAHECVCTPDCHCYESGPCAGHCPCIKPEKSEEKKSEAAAKCKCEKDCTDCKCSKKDGEWECECLAKKKKSESLQDLSYTFSKISADLDDAGYVKASVAVMRALEGLIAEAISPEEIRALQSEFGYDPEDAPLYEELTAPSEAKPELPAPEFEPPVSHEGARGFLTGEEPVAEMDFEDVGSEVFDEKIDEIKALLEAGKHYEATELLDALSKIIEIDPTDPRDLPPPSVEELAETELGEIEPPAVAPEGAPEGVGFGELETANKEIDEWLKKNAEALPAVHRVDRLDPELELDLDLKDLLTAEDGVETNLIDAYLAELDISFEDEE